MKQKCSSCGWKPNIRIGPPVDQQWELHQAYHRMLEREVKLTENPNSPEEKLLRAIFGENDLR